jgi:DNA polymerase
MPSVLAQATLKNVAAEAAHCQRCPLYKVGMQTVFGARQTNSPVILVGEQPGDQEDRQGLPFRGPAGLMLDHALEAAGVSRDRLYVTNATNAVKHFKNVPRGKRRLHQKPNAGEIDRCKWWLDQEIEIIKPELVVAMGTTAARSLAGRPIKILQLRGSVVPSESRPPMLVTIHPSVLLRLPDAESRALELQRFVADLRQITARVSAVRL